MIQVTVPAVEGDTFTTKRVLLPFIDERGIKIPDTNARHEAGRATGNTTRIIDDLVQQLFTKGECIVYEYESEYNLTHHNKAYILKYTLDRLVRRLQAEHPRIKFKVSSEHFKITLDENRIS